MSRIYIMTPKDQLVEYASYAQELLDSDPSIQSKYDLARRLEEKFNLWELGGYKILDLTEMVLRILNVDGQPAQAFTQAGRASKVVQIYLANRTSNVLNY